MLQLPTIFFLISFFSLAVLHILMLHFGIYERFASVSFALHLFVGIIFSLCMFTLRDMKIIPKEYVSLVSVVVFSMVCTVVWIGYERWAQFPIFGTIVITICIDLFIGLFGAVMGFYLGTRLRKLR